MGIQQVHVAELDGAGLAVQHGVLAGAAVCDLGDGAGIDACGFLFRGDHRRIVGAGDDNGHDAAVGAAVAVIDAQRVAVLAGLAVGQEVEIGIVDRELPAERTGGGRSGGRGVGSGEADTDISWIGCIRRNGQRVNVGDIDVAELDGAGLAVDLGVLAGAAIGDLGDSPGIDACGFLFRGDHRLVIGAVDGDHHILAVGAALAVVHLHREGQHQLIGLAEEVDGRIGGVVGPADSAHAVVEGRVGDAIGGVVQAERIQQGVDLGLRELVAIRQRGGGYHAVGDRRRRLVCQIDIGELDGTGHVGRVGVGTAWVVGRLGDGAGLAHRRIDHRLVVGAGNGDRDNLRRARRFVKAVKRCGIIINRDRVGDGDDFSLGEELHHVVV